AQDDDVAKKAPRLFVVPADKLIDGLDELLRAEHLGGMQTAVETNHRLAFFRQRARLIVGEPFGERQPARDFFVAIELLEVLRRRDDRHQLIAPFGGLADALDRDAIGLAIELPHELGELRVVRQHVIGANLMAEELLGRRDVLRCLGRRIGREQCEQQRDKGDWTSVLVHNVRSSCWRQRTSAGGAGLGSGVGTWRGMTTWPARTATCPSLITTSIFCRSSRFSSGLPSTTMMSASLPGARLPSLSSMSRSLALVIVAALSASTIE